MLFETAFSFFKLVLIGTAVKVLADEIARHWQSKTGSYRLDATSLLILDLALLLLSSADRTKYHDEWFIFLCEVRGGGKRVLEATGLVSAAAQIRIESAIHFVRSRPFHLLVKSSAEFLLVLVAVFALLPLLLIISLCFSLRGIAPISHKVRVGIQGKIIKVFRFNVSRTGRFNSFLRRTSIEELPMLWNVLQGDMALVGPIPLKPQEWEQLPPYLKTHRRFGVVPGIVGPAQIQGYRDANCSSNMHVWSLEEDYLSEWSLQKDAQIILATLKTEFIGPSKNNP